MRRLLFFESSRFCDPVMFYRMCGLGDTLNIGATVHLTLSGEGSSGMQLVTDLVKRQRLE